MADGSSSRRDEVVPAGGRREEVVGNRSRQGRHSRKYSFLVSQRFALQVLEKGAVSASDRIDGEEEDFLDSVSEIFDQIDGAEEVVGEADGGAEEVNLGGGEEGVADHLKKIAEKKLQLIPYLYCKPPKYKYRYSKEEDTQLTMVDKEQMNQEEADFDVYRRDVESARRTSFEQRTTLSSMHFAPYTPRQIPFGIVTIEATLQIFSFKIVSSELSWPLYVYGVVAVRDKVDDHRNILFERRRGSAQLVTRDEPSLGLFGPSRAISAVDPVRFEVELKLKGRTEYQDITLVKQSVRYPCAYIGFHTIDFCNCLCKAELRLEQLGNSVQATFLSVCVVEGGPCTFKYGGRVYCSSLAHEVMVTDSKGNVDEIADPPSSQFVLIDSRDCPGGKLPMYDTGLLDLARCVVCVPIDKANDYSSQYEESLKVVIQAYSPSGDVADQVHVKLRPKLSNTSRVKCVLGNSKVEIIIAWSVMLKSEDYLI